MPFDPLQTDEKLDQSAPRSGMDEAMLGGCGEFLLASVITFLAAASPFALLDPLRLETVLLAAAAISALAVSVGGFSIARRWGLASGIGSLSGTLAAGFYMFLRIDACFRDAASQFVPPPAYPAFFRLLVPLGAIALSLCGVRLGYREEVGRVASNESTGSDRESR